MSHILGYARASTDDQDLASQKQRLETIGALRIFEDVVSGKTFVRPGLAELFDFIRPGDTLAVVRLDRLGRSLRELLDVVETLKKRGVALMSLEEKSIHRPPLANWCSMFSARLRSSSGVSSLNAHATA
ncbi:MULTISPECIES: recombinase family protein [Methylosinus]|uniref:recombinase family protein n=1 Tax=Methylosinus TaxID=425 RepID=UPI00209B5789|nr:MULTISPECIES: recombinase family protein [Methylosinus]